jgi:hypothetical protein
MKAAKYLEHSGQKLVIMKISFNGEKIQVIYYNDCRATILSRYNDLIAMSLRVINEVDPANDKDNCIAKIVHVIPQLERLKNRFINSRINAGPNV